MLLTMTGGVKDAVLAKLDQFIFSEDVQLGDVTDTFAQIAIVGPAAAAVVAAIVDGVSEQARCATLPEHGNARGEWAGGAAIVTRIVRHGRTGLRSLRRTRAGGRAESGAGRRGRDRARRRRPLKRCASRPGVPLFGRDMDEETIPLEAGIESRAISFTKGLLRRAGGDHPRAAPRPRPRRAQAGRADAGRRSRSRRPARRSAAATARSAR